METWDNRKTAWLVILLALATVGALYWVSLNQRPQGSDVEQIRALMIRGERALEERSTSEAMRVVSRDYKDDQGMRFGSLRALVGRQLRQVRSVDISVPTRLLAISVDPDGKHATASARVDLRATTDSDTVHDLSSNLTFRFVKEPVRHYLLFPAEEWHLVKMEGWQGLGSE